MIIRNPWVNLASTPPFVLPEDKEAVEAYNDWTAAKGGEFDYRKRLRTNLLPDPFIGNVQAPIIVILANPGYTDSAKADRRLGCTGSDDKWHAESELLHSLYRANYAHEQSAYPMFFMDPRMAGSPGGYWYRNLFLKPLRHLFDDRKTVTRNWANRVFPLSQYGFCL